VGNDAGVVVHVVSMDPRLQGSGGGDGIRLRVVECVGDNVGMAVCAVPVDSRLQGGGGSNGRACGVFCEQYLGGKNTYLRN
jgi:hypothetical protein